MSLHKLGEARRGEITAFLSLIFILLISFIGALVESASIQVAKNMRRGEADEAIYSVFAEYQKTLLEEYDIFALEATYETGSYAEENLLQRMDDYGADTMEHKMLGLQLLTDQGGLPFREQIIRYMKNKYGLEFLSQWTDAVPSWQGQESNGKAYQEQDALITEDLQSQMEAVEGELSTGELPSGELPTGELPTGELPTGELLAEGNPLTNVNELKQRGLLQLVAQNPEQISGKCVNLTALPSGRSLQTGRGQFASEEETEGTESKLLINEYLLEHFSDAGEGNEEGMLSYETEYLLEGRESDQENLEAVMQKLLLMRLGANYAYLMTDAEKKLEAEALALALSSAFALPVLTEAVKQALLAAWAFGESIMDLRSLLNQKKVPFLKTGESWQLQLSNLLTLGTAEDVQEGSDSEDGQSYSEYLRILLFLEDSNMSSKRAIDLIEGNLRETHGLSFFRADHCVSKMEARHKAVLSNGITYEFKNAYSYR